MADELDRVDDSVAGTDPEAFTKMVQIGEREVLCRFLTEAQFMQLAYEAQIMESPHTPDARKIKTLTRIFRVMRSIVVEDEDKEYVEDLMADGTVRMSDVLAVIKELNDSVATPKSSSKVRRGAIARRR